MYFTNRFSKLVKRKLSPYPAFVFLIVSEALLTDSCMFTLLFVSRDADMRPDFYDLVSFVR